MKCIIFNREDYGGYWRRTFAAFIDGIILSIFYGFISSLEISGMAILQLIIFFVYMIGFKSYRGTTPGYRLFGMKIISINGDKANFIQIVVRMISATFSALCLGLGFIWIAFDKNRQAWHDKIAGTYVLCTTAENSRSTEISRAGLINYKAFGFVAFSICIIVVGLFGVLTQTIKKSDAYNLSVLFIKENQSIQGMVGHQLKFGHFPGGEISFEGDSGSAELIINVSGEKGEIYVCPSLEKRNGQWIIHNAWILNKDGDPITQINTEYTSEVDQTHTEVNTETEESIIEQGNFYFYKGQYRKSLHYYNRAVGINPNSADAYMLRGLAQTNLGQTDVGCNDLYKACALGKCNGLDLAKDKGDCK